MPERLAPLTCTIMHEPMRIFAFSQFMAAGKLPNDAMRADRTTKSTYQESLMHVEKVLQRTSPDGRKPGVVFLEFNLGNPGSSDPANLFKSGFFELHKDVTFVLITGEPLCIEAAQALIDRGLINVRIDQVGNAKPDFITAVDAAVAAQADREEQGLFDKHISEKVDSLSGDFDLPEDPEQGHDDGTLKDEFKKEIKDPSLNGDGLVEPKGAHVEPKI